MKLLIMPNSIKQVNELLENIDGIIVGLDKLCINMPYNFSLDEINELITICNENDKEIFISLNKNMFNSDLEYLKDTLIKLNTLDIDKILFYDLSVLSLVNKLNINKELVIYQDHLNNSIYSHNFNKKRNINSSFISSDFTY